jgi:hypothetical protein
MAPPPPQQAPDATRNVGRRAFAEFLFLREDAIARLRRGASPHALAPSVREEKARSQERRFGYERVAALDPASAAATVDRATLGLGTSVEGAEAGLVLSPAALMGSTNPRATAFNVFVGALKADETRFGARYALDLAADPPAVPLPDCAFDESQLRTALDLIANEYQDACEPIAGAQAPPQGFDPKEWAVAQAACGVPAAAYPKADDRNLDVALTVLPRALDALRGSSDAEIARMARALESNAKDMRNFDPTKTLDCSPAEKVLAERFRIQQWRRGARKVGFTTHADFFPRRFGFSPDGKELPHGQVKAWQARAEFTRQQGRGQWTVGAGYGRLRQDFKGDFTHSVTGNVSGSYMAFSLAGPLLEEKEIEEDGRPVKIPVIRIQDGKIVPHIVLGFLVKADIAPSPPATQDTHFNSFEAQAFMDFKIRENLSFRLGVPIRAELKTSAGEPKLSKLQWTVPVAIVTVIKL